MGCRAKLVVCGVRATHHLLGGGHQVELLLYADDLEVLGMGVSGRQGIPLLSYCHVAALGDPFKWAKTRGGFRVEWLGMETEYPQFKLGLSKKRADWLVAWLKDLSEKGKIGAKEMAQGLGRLGFAAIALDWERPFLGPLRAWSSAVQGKTGLMTVPTMVRVLAAWLAGRLARDDRLQKTKLTDTGPIADELLHRR